MSDIVDELEFHAREYPELIHGPLCGKAAAEIRRLQIVIKGADELEAILTAQVVDLRNEINGYKHDTGRLLEGERHLQAEIERLLAKVEQFRKECDLWDHQRIILTDENERLRAELKEVEFQLTMADR